MTALRTTDHLVTRRAPLPRLLGDLPTQKLVKAASSADVKRELGTVGIRDLPGSAFPIRKGHAYLLLVTTGSGDAYNFNENADWMPEFDGERFEFPEPCDPDVTFVVLGKGLRSTHSTFRQYGAVYRNHKTEVEHGVPRSGEIVWERWNPTMHRGELIVELPEAKWGKELALSEQGRPLMWSQGNGVPKDFCFPGHVLVDTMYGSVPISDVAEGWEVISHTGVPRKVTAKMQRLYTGPMMRIHARRVLPLEATANHPVLVLNADDVASCQGSTRAGKKRRHVYDDRGLCSVCNRPPPEPVWKPAGLVSVGDYVLSPVEGLDPKGMDSEDLAYVVGVYAGDGCPVRERHTRDRNDPHRRDYGVSISCGDSDPHIGKLTGCLERVTGKQVKTYAAGSGRRAVAVVCRSRELAAACRAAVGAGSHGKSLRTGFSTREAALSFLGGYIDADGSLDENTGGVRIVSVSHDLAFTARRLAIQAGLNPTIRKEKRNKEAAFPSSTEHTYWLSFDREDVEDLRPYSCKIGDRQGRRLEPKPNRHGKRQGLHVSYADGRSYFGYRITGVEYAQVFDLPVYNMEVAKEHTYVAGGFAVHNCTRCGFVFTPKTKERCKHIRFSKLCFGDDGIQNGMLCPDCTFYDISYVGNNPASKIAAALLRVASPEPAPSLAEAVRVFGAPRYPSHLVLRAARAAERSLDDGEVAGIRVCLAPDPERDAALVRTARKFEPAQALSALHRLEIVLTPTQFARIFLVSAEPTGVGGYLDALPGAFGRLMESDPGFADDAGYFPEEPPDAAVMGALAPFAAEFGIRETGRRPVIIVRTASLPAPRRRPSPEGEALAGEYARYLHACLALFGGPSSAHRCVGIMNAGL